MASIRLKTLLHRGIAHTTIALALFTAATSLAQDGTDTDTSSDAVRDIARNAKARRQNPVLQPERRNNSDGGESETKEPTAPPANTATTRLDGSATERTIDADKSDNTDITPAITYRTPLLREGSFLTEAPGRLIFDEAVGFWVFEAKPEYVPTTIAYRISPRFIMLPCTKLHQMQRTVESTSFETIFLVTGRITAFEDHNYLIPLDAPLIEQRERTERTERDDTTPQSATEQTASDEADALIQSIRREVPVARSLAAFEDAKEGAADALPSLTPEGTLIIARRGRIERNVRGGWEFIFTADADGLADAPMPLLPCLLLEHMQRTVDRRNTFDSMLLTGEVYTYRGVNFLLPTSYQMERFTDNVRR